MGPVRPFLQTAGSQANQRASLPPESLARVSPQEYRPMQFA